MIRTIRATCSLQKSPKCVKQQVISKHSFEETLQRNGKYICLYCSRTTKFSGRNNPNTKYQFDDNMFHTIDTEEKAYILGLVASDGTLRRSGFSIALKRTDRRILEWVKNEICADLIITNKKQDLKLLTVNSITIARDICNWLSIGFGKKSHLVQFPHSLDENLKWAFLRGYFDGDGSINRPGNSKSHPRCDISSNSEAMLKSIRDFCNIPCSLGKSRIYWSHNNALDFLAKLYDNDGIALIRKKDLFIDWAVWQPSIPGKKHHLYSCSVSRTRPDAVIPFKTRASDSGYDLTIIDIEKQWNNNVTLFTTGIKIQPEYGWYFDIVPRSSLSKTGWILANSLGIIDRTYIGPILVPLMRMPGAPDLPLPFRAVQMVPRQIVHFEIVDVDELSPTDRAHGGFGSTGNF